MEDLKIYKNIVVSNPVMIAGWPGMGNVALGAVDYLKNTLKAERFAEITVDPLTILDSVVVEEGLAKLPPGPQNTFYYAKKQDLIIFEGEAQIHGQAGIEILRKVLNVAAQFKVKRIYTGAAFPLPVSHKELPEVYGAVNENSLKAVLNRFGITAMDSGHISGLNGLMLGFAHEKKIEAICLLATMPQYAISLPNPKASGAIIETLERMVNFNVDLKGLSDYIKDMDEKMAVIEDKVKDVMTTEKEEGEGPAVDKKPPAYIMDKIEKLFREAEADKSKAIILKKELDRWDLYKLYEDRFLDLFKNNQ